MRVFRFGLHLWIALTSTFSFMAGWILLAHSPKPVQSASSSGSTAAPVPTLAPLPNLDFGSNAEAPAFQTAPFVMQAPNPAISMPVFRTGGS